MPSTRDWRDPSDYPFEGFTNKQWAWEFLRRNEQYKRDWQDTLPEHLEYIEDMKKQHLPTEHLEGYCSEDPDFLIPSMEAREKWGLTGLVNPEQDHPSFQALTFTTEFIRRRPLQDNEVNLTFDLNLPIKPQLERAFKFLSKIQKEQDRNIIRPKRHKENWVELLRIFDAYKLGAKPKLIASTLYPDLPNPYPDYPMSDLVKKKFRQARKIIDEDYIKIVMV